MALIWNDDPFQINTITMPLTKVYVDKTLLLISYKPRQPVLIVTLKPQLLKHLLAQNTVLCKPLHFTHTIQISVIQSHVMKCFNL